MAFLLYVLFHRLPWHTKRGANTWSERAFIGLMEQQSHLKYGWVAEGYVITNASDKGLNFNIKPNDRPNCYYKWNATSTPLYHHAPKATLAWVYGSWR